MCIPKWYNSLDTTINLKKTESVEGKPCFG